MTDTPADWLHAVPQSHIKRCASVGQVEPTGLQLPSAKPGISTCRSFHSPDQVYSIPLVPWSFVCPDIGGSEDIEERRSLRRLPLLRRSPFLRVRGHRIQSQLVVVFECRLVRYRLRIGLGGTTVDGLPLDATSPRLYR